MNKLYFEHMRNAYVVFVTHKRTVFEPQTFTAAEVVELAYEDSAADIEEILAGTKDFEETEDDQLVILLFFCYLLCAVYSVQCRGYYSSGVAGSLSARVDSLKCDVLQGFLVSWDSYR